MSWLKISGMVLAMLLLLMSFAHAFFGLANGASGT